MFHWQFDLTDSDHFIFLFYMYLSDKKSGSC